METRIMGLIGLLINYTFLLIFGIGFVYFTEWLLKSPVDGPMVITTMVVMTSIFPKHMRRYWKAIVFGDRKTYSDHRPGFTNEIMDEPKTSDDLVDLLQATTKAKSGNHSDLKRNPLDD